ncbi:uncharacterized protein EDB93DRAFT_1334544, partial [Suillus bovinus]|uniref:uncharacterized protein n=1 Tax=Suillus bovinus TaxID=48563 RepID=UPI001B88567A
MMLSSKRCVRFNKYLQNDPKTDVITILLPNIYSPRDSRRPWKRELRDMAKVHDLELNDEQLTNRAWWIVVLSALVGKISDVRLETERFPPGAATFGRRRLTLDVELLLLHKRSRANRLRYRGSIEMSVNPGLQYAWIRKAGHYLQLQLRIYRQTVMGWTGMLKFEGRELGTDIQHRQTLLSSTPCDHVAPVAFTLGVYLNTSFAKMR